MKRLHAHLGVTDLDRSIGFYTTLVGAPLSVREPDDEKWMLEDPRVNFAISHGRDDAGVSHLGMQVDDVEELTEVSARLRAADRPVHDEGAATCCYARSTKSWVSDPDGVVWEAFHTHADATDDSTSPALASLAAAAA